MVRFTVFCYPNIAIYTIDYIDFSKQYCLTLLFLFNVLMLYYRLWSVLIYRISISKYRISIKCRLWSVLQMLIMVFYCVNSIIIFHTYHIVSVSVLYIINIKILTLCYSLLLRFLSQNI